MRKEVFDEYYKIMAKILKYKEIDKNGNEQNATVSVAEAKKHPEKYVIYECKDQKISNIKFAYDPSLVQKQADLLRKICSIIPQDDVLQSKKGISSRSLLNDENPNAKDLILAETFLAMSQACGILGILKPYPESPLAKAILREKIPTSYKEPPSHDEK